MRGNEKKMVIYLNDLFGFKPDEISIQKTGTPQDNPDDKKPNDPNTQVEIFNLKAELNQVKNDLEKLKKFISKAEGKNKGSLENNPDLKKILEDSKEQLNKLENKNNSSSTSPDKGFFRKEIIIPVAVGLAIIILIGIIF